VIDGSTWDPWAKRLIFTTENPSKPTYAATADYPSQVEDVSGALGRGGYEGVQNDSAGNLWIVEDIGGSNKSGTVSKLPNSFIYRYVPKEPGNANTLAKAAQGTPFKRPENGQFRPGAEFKQFFFDETGDTNALSTENGDKTTGTGGSGGWGAIQSLTQSSPSADTGKLSLFFLSNENQSGFDNVAFLSSSKISFVEDAGDLLHTQRSNDTRAGVAGVNAGFDAAYVFDVNVDYSNTSNKPARWLAQGRDASAAIDGSTNGAFPNNDGDNEITGLHISDGDPGVDGILCAKVPHVFHGGWRWFWSQQHGDNFLFEVIPAGAVGPAGASG
jgi:secreted PhoX family phosphatase